MKRLQASLVLVVLSTACLGDPAGPGVLSLSVEGAGPDTVWLGAPGERAPSGIRLHVTDDAGRALPAASVEWEALGRGALVLDATAQSNAAGIATATWQLGTDAAEEQQLRVTVRSARRENQILIRARAVPYLVSQVSIALDTPAVVRLGDTLPVRVIAIDPYGNEFAAPDVVLSVADSSVASIAGSSFVGLIGGRRGQSFVRVASHAAAAVFPLQVRQYVAAIVPVGDILQFSALGAELPVGYVVLDDRGRVVADTVVAIEAADPAIVQVVGGNVRAVASGITSLRLSLGPASATMLAGVEQRVGSLRLVRDTIRLDALKDTTTLEPLVHDSLGSPIANPSLAYNVSDPTVARFAARTLEALQPGAAIVTVRDSVTGVSTSAPLVVTQRVTAIDVAPTEIVFDALGDSIGVGATGRDRLGSVVLGRSFEYAVSDTTVVVLDSTNQLRAVEPGQAFVTARDPQTGVLGSAPVSVRQIAVSIALDRYEDTLDLGEDVALSATAADANGFPIADGTFEWESSDDLVAPVLAGRVSGVGPGGAIIRVRMDHVFASVTVTVEGVALYLNGERWSGQGSVSPDDSVLLTNGRLRLWLSQNPTQRAGVIADVWFDGTWHEATSRKWGDWTYVGTSVFTAPTRVDVLVNDGREVAVRWTYGNHWFLPHTAGFPADYPEVPYPFEKTVWLRRTEQGYYALIQPLAQLPPEAKGVEHEIGFGGLFGAGEIRTSGMSLLTDTLSRTVRYDPGRIDASQFARQNDPVGRVLVSLYGAAMLTPWFWSEEFGGVVVHSLPSAPYGAYIYAAAGSDSTSARSVCQRAAQEAPFSLPPIAAAALDGCGPEP